MSELGEKSIKSAVDLIALGQDPEKVIRFIYNLGHAEGALEMAKRSAEKISQEALKKASA